MSLTDIVNQRTTRFVTFGYDHTHTIKGIHLDHNCVAVIRGTRDDVFKLFKKEFSMEFPAEHWDDRKMDNHFPDGYKLIYPPGKLT